MIAVVNAKYGTDYTFEMVDPVVNSVYAMKPEWVFALDPNDFVRSPTRFTFTGPPSQ